MFAFSEIFLALQMKLNETHFHAYDEMNGRHSSLMSEARYSSIDAEDFIQKLRKVDDR